MTITTASVRLPGLYMLWAPKIGPVLGTLGLTGPEASNRLLDRHANGESFPGECVQPLQAMVNVQSDGTITGYVHPVERVS